MRVGSRELVASGRGLLGPLPFGTPTAAPLDQALRRQLVGAFEPWAGFCIVNEGLLTFAQNGQAHCYVTRAQAQHVLHDLGQPAGYEITEVLAADRASCTRTMV
jgi:hypothetical protein